MTLKLSPKSLAGRAVRERNVVVGNVVEEVELLLFEHESGCN